MTLVAGIDSSTQSCKVVIRDLDSGAVVRSGRASHPSGTEVDPEFWWEALRTAIADAGGLDDVAAVSVGGQQHGMVALDASGRVIRPALLWNDTRSAQAALDLIDEVGAADFAERTGTVPVASFTITKLRWLADAEPDNAARVAAVALPHDWLTWRLRGFGPHNPVLAELITDRSDASGTTYFDSSRNDYDRALLALALRRPTADDVVLPAVLQPDEFRLAATETPGNAAATPTTTPATGGSTVVDPAGTSIPLPARIRFAPGAGDNAAAALGLGAVPGDVVVSIGTSGTVFAVTESPARDATGVVAGFADAAGNYLPLVATLNAARILDAISTLLDADHTELGRLALSAEPGSAGAVLQPYFEGERTPNLPQATGTLFGMTLASTTRPNLARAAIEGMLCGLADGLDALRSQGVVASRLLLIGGAAQNPAVSTIAAQVFSVPVVVPEPGEYVAAGAAAQAAWVVTGSRPTWPIALLAEPAVDFRPVIRDQYRAVAVV
ncbi:xylulokinase [Glaciihabitans tibetensis]|uniref:Xylulose kinase n=1 Tax=Glaciihabitans tibetensis TaxID=1266600 RepID=A0A2T0V6Z7_9MICO|nr:FGGY family carbohydrate kinase [Glaciihabitans tibetensis]PRY65950.1 xylulokinase [Glaciihabitans tibetensis]